MTGNDRARVQSSCICLYDTNICCKQYMYTKHISVTIFHLCFLPQNLTEYIQFRTEWRKTQTLNIEDDSPIGLPDTWASTQSQIHNSWSLSYIIWPCTVAQYYSLQITADISTLWHLNYAHTSTKIASRAWKGPQPSKAFHYLLKYFSFLLKWWQTFFKYLETEYQQSKCLSLNI